MKYNIKIYFLIEICYRHILTCNTVKPERSFGYADHVGYSTAIYRNVTDFVTDNVTNRKTVTFRVTEKVTDQDGA